MAEPKAFASLSSGLLARKGAAKPAMRPQAFGQIGVGIEDLGWNDMGHAPQAPEQSFAPPPEHVPSSIAALTPAPRSNVEPLRQEESLDANETDGAEEAQVDEEVHAPPPVLEQLRVIETTFAPPEQPKAERPVKSASVVPIAPRERKSPGGKAKAAFTLRLDAERHLKLRLACAVTHRSAQAIVTEALDEFLASLPELDAMSSHVKSGKRK